MSENRGWGGLNPFSLKVGVCSTNVCKSLTIPYENTYFFKNNLDESYLWSYQNTDIFQEKS